MRMVAQRPEIAFHQTACLWPVELPLAMPNAGFRIRHRSHSPFSTSCLFRPSRRSPIWGDLYAPT